MKTFLKGQPAHSPLGGPSFAAQNYIASTSGETLQALIRTPAEVVKSKMQLGKYDSVSSSVSHIVKTKGIPGLFTGYLSLVLREIPFSFI